MRDSDAPVVFAHGRPAGGTALTVELAQAAGRPCHVVDLDAAPDAEIVAGLVDWLRAVQPRVLNVAGSRASESPEIGAEVVALLRAALTTLDA